MPRVLYFFGGEEEAKGWGIAHGGEREVLLYGETEQVPRAGDFVFLQSATTMDGDIHQYWAKVKAVQLVAFQPSDDLGEDFTTEVRVFLAGC